MKQKTYICSFVLLLAGSCAVSPKSETVAQGNGDARTGTSEIATLRAENADLAAARLTAQRDLKAALAQIEELKAEVSLMKTNATAGRDLQLETAVAQIRAEFSETKTAIQGTVGEMKAEMINNRNTTINGMTGWQQVAAIAVIMAFLLIVYFVVSKTWNTHQIAQHEKRAVETVTAAVVNATK